ncbi:MAG TPA: hypothetical protein VF670_19045 [Duganella sp.]
MSLTRRLMVVALCASVALLVLLFALGFQVGRGTAGAAADKAVADRFAEGVAGHAPATTAIQAPAATAFQAHSAGAAPTDAAGAAPRAPRPREAP